VLLACLLLAIIAGSGYWWFVRSRPRVGILNRLTSSFGAGNSGLWPAARGYIDAAGTLLIDLGDTFAPVGEFSDGRAVVTAGSQYGYIDTNGKPVIQPQFEYVRDFTEGRGPVRVSRRWGYVDSAGKLVINPQFDWADDFADGFAAVLVEKRWGFIGPDGAFKINPQFDGAGKFANALAPVQVGGRYGFIASDGTMKVNPQFDSASSFSEELAEVTVQNRKGFIRTDGTFAIQPQFDDASRFSESLAAVALGKKWGYVDPNGKYVVNPQFDYATVFAEGLAAAKMGDRWGYIDRKGVLVIPARYIEAGAFKGGLARVADDSGRRGYIKPSGEWAHHWSLPFRFVVEKGKANRGFRFAENGELSLGDGVLFTFPHPENLKGVELYELHPYRTGWAAVSLDIDGQNGLYLLDFQKVTRLPGGAVAELFVDHGGTYLLALSMYEGSSLQSFELRSGRALAQVSLGPSDERRFWIVKDGTNWQGGRLSMKVDEVCNPYDGQDCDATKVLATRWLLIDPATLTMDILDRPSTPPSSP
jgi:hypothetical protein